MPALLQYPEKRIWELGGDYEVEHYATFVKRLVDSGRLRLGKRIDTVMTYHDPCYLGRFNGVYEEPRQLIEAIPGVTLQEVPKRNRSKSFCCGAGGGHMFFDETSGRHINHIRTEQALETAPGTIGVSCPLCLQMFEEDLEEAGRTDVGVLDVIAMVAESSEESS